MSLWKIIKFMFSIEENEGKQREGISEYFKKRYYAFQELLSDNNAVLEDMADMSEKLSGDYLFDRRYLDTIITDITERIKNIIDNINLISNKKYPVLYERYKDIHSQITYLLTKKSEIPVDRYVLPLDEINKQDADRVGSKSANLGEIKSRVSLPVPDGFAISSYAFKHFMEYNGFMKKINEMLSETSINNIESLNNTSKKLQELITTAEIPSDLEKGILDAYAKLCSSYSKEVMVSVRSSALQEDGEFSFAGQYSTFLNVSGSSLLQRYKEVVASLFNQRALFYFKTKGLQEYDLVMSVAVLKMVDARAGGVMYSRDPNNPKKNTTIISAVRGLGKCVVDGTITPETYFVSRDNGNETIEKKLTKQQIMIECKFDGGIEETAVDDLLKGTPCLSDDEIKALSNYALKLEEYFKCPQDIEWAIDKNNQLYILQSRPLRITARETAKPVPPYVEGYRILIEKGVIACNGIGFGRVHIVRTDEDLKDFPEGAVLVARHTSTKFVTVMNKTSAIITDVGPATGHMASLAREFQVPTILDTEVATDILKNGQEITVDAVNCNVYEGRVNELAEFAVKKEEPFKETQLFKTLEKVLKLVTPLNLVDPDNKNFKPLSCITYHDITRFCHEMAMHELFDAEYISADDVGAVKLVAGIPTDIYLLDVGNAIQGSPKYLYPEHLLSAPFNAFLKGLTSMKWPEAKPFDVKGFIGAVAHTATISEEDIQRSAEKSFSFITKDYMNFAIRLGYHLSTIEAYAGENVNDNYIKFFFKGGGAIIDRRLRRVRLIASILKCLDFNVIVTDDVIKASLTKYKKETIEQKLEIMGKMTVYTKQLDMVMYNDAITDSYIAEFCSSYIPAKI
jgi:pyruvate,water dikinase